MKDENAAFIYVENTLDGADSAPNLANKYGSSEKQVQTAYGMADERDSGITGMADPFCQTRNIQQRLTARNKDAPPSSMSWFLL